MSLALDSFKMLVGVSCFAGLVAGIVLAFGCLVGVAAFGVPPQILLITPVALLSAWACGVGILWSWPE